MTELDFDSGYAEFDGDYFSDDGSDMNDLDHYYNQIQNQKSWISQLNLDSIVDLGYQHIIFMLKIIFIIVITFLMQQWLRP